MWVPAGMAAVCAVQNAGISCGQSIWQGTIILNSFVWGLFILKDTHFHNNYIGGFLIFGLIVSVVGMTLCFAKKSTENQRVQPSMDESLTSVGSVKSHNDQGSMVLGVGAALFNGIWGGANLVPSKYSPYHGIRYALSYSYGAAIANICLLIAYALLQLIYGRPFPSFHFRVMAFPGFLSGCAWSAGNFCSLYAVNALGEGIGYSLIQASVIISGAWGIILYGELSGYRILIWSFFLLICVATMVGLALEKSSH